MHIPRTLHTHLRNLLLSASLCGMSTSSMAMQNNDLSIPMGNGQNPFDLLPKDIIGKIGTHLNHPNDVGNMRLTNKKNSESIDKTSQSLFVQGYDKTNSEILNMDALYKAEEMGYPEAREIIVQVAKKKADELYQMLKKQKDNNVQLSLCTDLTKDGLFLFLDEKNRASFIFKLWFLARNKEDFLTLFLGLTKDFPEMTEAEQVSFIKFLYTSILPKEGARQTFLDLESKKESMKKNVREDYEEKLNELNNPQENLNI